MTPAKKPDKKESVYKPVVPALDQAIKVLLCLTQNGQSGLNLTEICRQVEIHKSKGFSILHTLGQYNFVEKNVQAKTYSLGPGLLPLARSLLDHSDLRDFVTPELMKLSTETNSTALLGLISDEQVFIIAKREGSPNIGVTIGIGHRFPLTAGAHGKAIVAFLPEADRAKILQSKRLYFYGESERLDLRRLREELEAARQSGYAADLGGLHPGVNAVSAPLLGPHAKIMGCLILIGTFAENQIEGYGAKIAKTGRELSAKLGYRPG